MRVSVATSLNVTSVGLTPNPVNVGGAYLVQAGASETNNTWSDWSATSWSSISSLKWGGQ